MTHRSFVFMSMIFSLIFTACLATTTRAGDGVYDVYLVDPAINDQMILQNSELPGTCETGNVLRVAACRGEYESAAFVVSASDSPVVEMRVAVRAIEGPGRPWPLDVIHLRVVDEINGQPIALVHDDHVLDMIAIHQEETPETIDKLNLRDADTLQPVTIDGHKQFWLTVQVPQWAEPGTYNAVLELTADEHETTQLTLEIEVYPFELLESRIEYSIYHPAYIGRDPQPGDPRSFSYLTDEQFAAEMNNMLAHGLDNPNIYQGPKANSDGSLDFTTINHILDLRESAGMRPDALYLIGHPIPMETRPLTSEEHQRTARFVPRINAWAKARGYNEVYFAGGDEWWGEELDAARESYQAIRDAGGKSFVALMHTTFFDRVNDVLDRPVLQSTVSAKINAKFIEYMEKYGQEEALRRTAEMTEATGFEMMITDPEYRQAIDGYHRMGKKIYTYMNPMAGFPFPDLQRRCEGLGMWRVGFDGTMTWAYTHITSPNKLQQPMQFAMVYRTDNGVIDTLHWEGFREAVDDIRYLTTLHDALNRAAGSFPDEPLISQTHKWLAGLDVIKCDLDMVRCEMAARIIALQDLGYKPRTDEEVLADLNLDDIEVVTLPEAWRFKIDPDNVGVTEAWFASEIDDSDWPKLHTNVNTGWERQGFGDQEYAYGWYRTTMAIDKTDATFAYLYFGAVDEEAWIYLNGEEVFEHSSATTGLVPERIWLKPFAVPLDQTLSGNDSIAVRVHNTGGMAGIWKPVYLILSGRPLEFRQLSALAHMHEPSP